MPETRKEATERTTAAAGWWLWSIRHARALGLEVGIDFQGRLVTPWNGRWRADLVGVCRRGKSNLNISGWRIALVEVKGTRSDLAREELAPKYGQVKWQIEIPGCELWVACGDEATAALAIAEVPAHWGVVVFAQGAKRRIARKPAFDEDLHPGDVRVMDAFRALAEVNTAQRMPRIVSAQFKGDAVDRMFAEGWARQWREYGVASGHNSDVGRQLDLITED